MWDYTVKGADDKTVEAFNKKITQNPPRQGGVQVHNEQVEIKPQTPDMKGADMSEAVRTVKLYGLGGAGLPAWFFADPVDANRSTADEMTGPTGKKLTRRQNQIRGLISHILAFVVQQAIYHGVLPEKVDTTVKIQTPDLMIKDLQKAAGTLGAASNALSIGEENGWIKSETAARGFHMVLSQIGIEVDSKDEFQAAQQEKKQRQTELAPEQSNLAQALNDLEQQGKAGAAQ